MSHRDQTIAELLSGIASDRVAPAGGSGAAIVGAIGAALCEMACIHTGNESRAEAANLAAVGDDLRRQRTHLLNLADTDASLVDELFAGPDGAMDDSEIKRSVGVPLTIAEACLNVLDLAIEVTESGDKNAVLDAGTGVHLVHAALQASVLTARSNLDQLSDRSFVSTVQRRVTEIAASGDESYRQALANVENRS